MKRLLLFTLAAKIHRVFHSIQLHPCVVGGGSQVGGAARGGGSSSVWDAAGPVGHVCEECADPSVQGRLHAGALGAPPGRHVRLHAAQALERRPTGAHPGVAWGSVSPDAQPISSDDCNMQGHLGAGICLLAGPQVVIHSRTPWFRHLKEQWRAVLHAHGRWLRPVVMQCKARRCSSVEPWWSSGHDCYVH